MLELLLTLIAAVAGINSSVGGGAVIQPLALPQGTGLSQAETSTRQGRTPPTTQAPITFATQVIQPDRIEEPWATSTPVPQPTTTTTASRKVVNGTVYDAYIPAPIKKGQWFQYTCEFDAAWIVLKAFGYDVGLEEQAAIVGLAEGPEPYHKQTANGVVIYGGDIFNTYSGSYKKNFLARSTGKAMRKLFEHYDLKVTAVNTRAGLEAALRRGELVWIKTTVDFKDWVPATWIMPDGTAYKTVLGNDHALVVMGFNENGVVIRDPLGPTSTGRTRPYEYQVSWSKFMRAWGAQQYDGLAVGK